MTLPLIHILTTIVTWYQIQSQLLNEKVTNRLLPFIWDKYGKKLVRSYFHLESHLNYMQTSISSWLHSSFHFNEWVISTVTTKMQSGKMISKFLCRLLQLSSTDCLTQHSIYFLSTPHINCKVKWYSWLILKVFFTLSYLTSLFWSHMRSQELCVCAIVFCRKATQTGDFDIANVGIISLDD